MEGRIHEAEAELARLEREAAENASNASRLIDLHAKIAEFQKRIEALYSRWAELE
jgi:uncharacterized protein YigA (DUF484 family)